MTSLGRVRLSFKSLDNYCEDLVDYLTYHMNNGEEKFQQRTINNFV